MMAVIFVSSLRRSSFGWLIISVEYFNVLGLGVFPLLLSVNAIDMPQSAIDYESRNGELTVATFVHIFLFGLGALFGYFGARPFARKASLRIMSFAANNKLDNYSWFYIVSGLSILFSGLYFGAVGFEIAIVTASSARGNDFSGLVGFEQYQFLKTLAMIGLFSMVFVPYIILDRRRIKSTFLIVALFTFPIYILTVARGVFVDTFVLFAVFYICFGRSRCGSIILLVVISSLMIFVFLFGKIFVGVLSVYLFGGGGFELAAKDESASAMFFGHFGHLIYSIDAGIRNFFAHGPVLSPDILLSPLGFLPSFVFSAFGMDALSYQIVSDNVRLSCINADYFSAESPCSFPPYYTGTSAYLFPVVGGLLFGVVKFWIYSVIEISWMRLMNRPQLLWFPVFLFFIATRLMLFIPNTISFAFFMMISLLLTLNVKKIFVSRKQSACRQDEAVEKSAS